MEVCLVQYDIAWEQKSLNHARVRHLLTEYSPQSGSLIVLPEMFSTGFSMNLEATVQGVNREDEMFLADVARQFGCVVLAGVVTAAEHGRGANQAVAFAPSGEALSRMTKLQSFTFAGEHKFYSSGDGVSVFAWKEFRVAPFVCYDLRFPEHFRRTVRQGAEVLVVIASWPARRSEHWRVLLQARAIENQAYVLGVNRCGRDDSGLVYAGGSIVFGPQGELIAEADGSDQVLKASLPRGPLEAWRRDFPALADMGEV